jgi:PIN domain nuclease of toxin-antitoxin system
VSRLLVDTRALLWWLTDDPAPTPAAREAIAEEGFAWLPVTPAHAWQVRDLPAHHRDPFDRLLVAQALAEDIPIVTADPRFEDYGVAVRW